MLDLADARAGGALPPIGRWSFLVHRYLGFAMSLLFLIWFLSGFVMMYRGFPSIDFREKLSRAKAILPAGIRLSPGAAGAKLDLRSLDAAKIAMVLDRPVYRFSGPSGDVRTLFADSGEPLVVDEALARSVAAEWHASPSQILSVERMEERDQWTPTGAYVRHLPLFRVRFDDLEATVAYVSSTSGEVVQALSLRDKIWAWLGPIPHWIYFRSLRVRQGLWEWVVIVLSAIGVVTCLAGLLLGFLLYRRTVGSLRFSPFENAWFRWHHTTGFLFGFFVFTWTLSGLLSMNPLDWSPSRELSPDEESRFRGGDLDPARLERPPRAAVETLSGIGAVKELELIQVRGRAYYVAYYVGNETRLLPADRPDGVPLAELRESELLEALAELSPAPVAETKLLTEYDAYYYGERGERRLPVLRVRLSDPARTWFYVSPRTGAVVDRLETRSRWNRWLYHGLHSFDFPGLRDKRPGWDLVVLSLMTGGTLACATGVVLTFRWIRRATGATRATRDDRRRSA